MCDACGETDRAIDAATYEAEIREIRAFLERRGYTVTPLADGRWRLTCADGVLDCRSIDDALGEAWLRAGAP
jgi:hypothetical protein